MLDGEVQQVSRENGYHSSFLYSFISMHTLCPDMKCGV
jgi:hypothetical protein